MLKILVAFRVIISANIVDLTDKHVIMNMSYALCSGKNVIQFLLHNLYISITFIYLIAQLGRPAFGYFCKFIINH